MPKVQFMFIVSLVFAILITIFALTNASPIVIHLFFYEFTASQALIIFISAALGAVIVTSLGAVRYLRIRGQLKVLQKANEELEAKLQSLTAEPHAKSAAAERTSEEAEKKVKDGTAEAQDEVTP
jgi:uncharacterized integral membrane protein